MWQSFSILLGVNSLLLSEMVWKKLIFYRPSTRAILGNTGKKLVTVQAFLHLVHSKMAGGQYSPVWLKQSRCLSSFFTWYSGLEFSSFKNKKFFYTKNKPKILTKCDKILTNKEPIDLRTIVSFNTITYKLKWCA